MIEDEKTLMPNGQSDNGLISICGNVLKSSRLSEDKLYDSKSKFELHLQINEETLTSVTKEIYKIYEQQYQDVKPYSTSIVNDNLVIKFTSKDNEIYSFKDKTKPIDFKDLETALTNAMVFVIVDYKTYSISSPNQQPKSGVSCRLKELYILGYYEESDKLTLSPSKRKWLTVDELNPTTEISSSTASVSSRKTKFNKLNE